MRKVLRSCTSLLLAFCLLLGVCSNGLAIVAADFGSADKDGDRVVNLVSYGDSMTNGFGLEGYDRPAKGQNGYLDYGYVSYANQLAAWLAGLDWKTEGMDQAHGPKMFLRTGFHDFQLLRHTAAVSFCVSRSFSCLAKALALASISLMRFS